MFAYRSVHLSIEYKQTFSDLRPQTNKPNFKASKTNSSIHRCRHTRLAFGDSNYKQHGERSLEGVIIDISLDILVLLLSLLLLVESLSSSIIMDPRFANNGDDKKKKPTK